MNELIFDVLLAWISAFVIIEAVANTFLWWRSRGAAHSAIHEYYHRIPLMVVVLGDLTYSTLIFLTAIAMYARMYGTAIPSEYVSIARFAAIFVGIQWTFDLTWAAVVAGLRSRGITNAYLDFFDRYMREIGIWAAIGDTLYGLMWLAMTYALLKYTGDLVKYALIFAGVFLAVVVGYK